MLDNFFSAYKEFWIKATDFKGFTSRSDWWLVQLANLIISFLTIPIFLKTFGFNSYEAFQDFESGKNPRDVAEDFISRNNTAISEVFENFDEEDKDTLDQFLKLTECEMHVFRILEKQIELRKKIRYVDFKKRKK